MATQYANGKIVTDGLVLCLDAADPNSYPGSGTTWTDVAGTNNGTLVNGPTYSDGSIVFDGVDDYVDCGNNNNLQLPAITIETTIKFTNISNTIIGAKRYSFNSDMSYFLGQSTTSGKLRWGTSVNGTTQDALDTNKNDFTTGIIYHVVVIYDHSQNNKSIWINSTLDISTSTNGNLYNSSENTLIGADGRITATLPGNIYNYKIYNRALTSQEVLQNYNAQKSRFGL